MSTTGMTEAVHQSEEKRNDYEGRFFLGTVVDNNDPKKEERLRIRIPNLIGEETPDDQIPWARPVKHRLRGPKTGVSTLSVPDIGSLMVVLLQDGDPYHPLYLGGLLRATDLADVLKANYPKRYGLTDDKGNHFYVDTQTGDMEVKHFSGLILHVTPEGKIQITAPAELALTVQGDVDLNTQGNLTITTGGSTTVNSSGDVTVTAPNISLN